MFFKDLISRADDETIEELLGRPLIRLLRLLDPSLITPSRLKALALDAIAEHSFLTDPSKRSLVVDLLRKDEAVQLATAISLDTADSYSSLKSVRLTKGSEREGLFLRYFDVTPQRLVLSRVDDEQTCECNYSLFAHQRRAVYQVAGFLSESPHRVLLHMPTGSGKTRTAMRIMADHFCNNEPTLAVWLAYSEELCEQAALEFERSWASLGNRKLSLYRFWGGHNLAWDDLNDGFVVAGLGKTFSAAKASIANISKLAARTSLVVIDEAHQAIAESYKLVLDVLFSYDDKTGLLGLSATPGRTWTDMGQDEKLAKFFGRNKVTLTAPHGMGPIEYLTREKYIAKTSFRPLLSEGGMELSKEDLRKIESSLDIPQDLLEKFAADELRNLAIVAEIQSMVGRHHRILVFAATVAHAKLLSVVLNAKGVAADYIVASTDRDERSAAIKKFKSDVDEALVLCNHGVLTTGFDAPQASAAIIARPTKSLVLYSQMVGRVIRGPKAGGTETAEVVTVVDTSLPGFRDLGEAFSNWDDVWR